MDGDADFGEFEEAGVQAEEEYWEFAASAVSPAPIDRWEPCEWFESPLGRTLVGQVWRMLALFV